MTNVRSLIGNFDTGLTLSRCRFSSTGDRNTWSAY